MQFKNITIRNISYGLIGVIIIILLIFLGFNKNNIVEADWFDEGWHYRKKLTIDNSASSEHLADFPLLVTLNSSRIDYSETQNSGQDIRFTDPDGIILKYEIEKWDEAGTSTIWVKIPQIDAGSTVDHIYMYYGHPDISDGQDAENVWDSNFKMVQHLEESSNPYTDSSSNSFDSTGGTYPTLSSSGKINGAQDFDSGSSEYITMGTVLGKPTNYTIEGWIKAESWGSAGPFSSSNGSDSTTWGFIFRDSGDNVELWTSSGSAGQQAIMATDWNSTGFPSANWIYIVGTVDGSNIRYYKNGGLVNTISQTVAQAGTPLSFSIGRLGEYAGFNFNGLIDEVRVSDTARSTEWIEAQYLSTTDALLTYGSSESSPGVNLLLRMDEGSGTSTKDDSNYDNDGTISGATWITGKYGKGLSFDGTNDNISISDAGSIDMGIADWSISSWIKTNATSAQTILTKGTSNDGGDSWYNSSWDYRKKLTFDNSDSSEDLTNFPVLVQLTSSNFSYNNTSSVGADIRFTDSNGTTLLDYEIEDWNQGATSTVWVEVPQVNATSSSDYIYMYYGNSSASDGQDIEGTWDSNFVMVQHLQETGSNPQVVDSTSNNNDSNANTSDPTTSGKVNGAMDFTHTSSDYITVTSSSADFFASSFTIESWINIGANSDNQQIVAAKDSSGDPLIMFQNINTSDIMRLYVKDSASTALYIDGSTNVQGGWHYLVGTVDATNNDLDIYIDGSSDATTVDISSLNDSYGVNTDLVIGAGASSHAYDHVNGVLDEIRISNIARSSEWIEAQHKSITSNYITFENEEGQGYSLELLANGKLRAIIASGSTTINVDSSSTINDNEWHHIETTYDRSGNLIIYVDGKNKGSVSISSLSAVDISSASGLYISSDIYGENYFNGSLDDIRIYNYERSAAQVKLDYEGDLGTVLPVQFGNGSSDKGTSSVAYFRIDNGSGTTSYDDTTNNNDGTITGATWITGKYGNALDFNGSSDYVTVSDSTSLSITGDLSISAWIRPDAIGSEQTVLGKWDETTALLDKSYRLWLDSSNKLNLSVSTDGTTVVTHTGSDTTFVADTWYHIEALYDNAGTMDLYVNGKLDVTQKSSGVPASLDDNISNLYIGGKENTSGAVDTFFNGAIDDVRVYNYERSASEVRVDYNQGMAANLGEATQEWFNKDWKYRKKHNIVGSSSEDLVNYQIPFVVHYGSGTDSGNTIYLDSKSQIDFDDIRFTDNIVDFDYWIETYTSSDQAKIWVEIPYIPISPAKKELYIYYGNSSAVSKSNGEQTFVFFDDFSGASLDTDKWGTRSVGTASVTLSGGEADFTLTSNGAGGGAGYTIYSKQDLGNRNFTVRGRVKRSNAYSGGEIGLAIGLTDITSFDDTYYATPLTYARATLQSYTLNNWRLRSFYTAAKNVSGGSGPVDFIGYWADVEADISYDDKTIDATYIYNSNTYDLAATDPASSALTAHHAFINYGDWSVSNYHSYADYIYVAEYISSAPTHSSWGSEEQISNPDISWWDEAWHERIKLSIDNSDSSETLSNFPILVTLNSSRIDYGQTQDSGQDIRFIDSHGTILNHEIEKWDETGTSTVWVKIPSITAQSTSEYIYMYYDNINASDGQNVESVWDSNFVMVQHMNDATTSTTTDSTSNNNDGSKASANHPNEATGQISNAQDFDGTDTDYMEVADSAELHFGTSEDFSVSVWIKRDVDADGTTKKVVAMGASDAFTTSGARGWAIKTGGNNLKTIATYGDNSVYVSLTTDGVYDYRDGLWHHVASTFDRSGNIVFYVDGVIIDSSDMTAIVNVDDTTYTSLDIGTYVTQTTHFFPGLIDEINVSNIVRSAEWIEANYLSTKDSMLTYSSPEKGFDTVLYMRLDENQGSVSYDDTNYNNDGTIYSTSVADPWYNSSWAYRKKLTFDNSDSTENLTNFPVMVKLTASNFAYNNASLVGSDIRFTDSDGTTLLDYEFEDWSQGGTSYVWVEVPQIDLGSTTDYIYMYYGNSGASDGQDIEGTWNSNYKGVWHLEETGTSDVRYDATSNNCDSTTTAITNGDVDGQIDGGDEYDGGGDYINMGDLSSLEPTSVTLEVWSKHDSSSRSLDGGVTKGQIFGNGTEYSYKLDFSGGTARWNLSDSSNNGHNPGTISITDTNWHYWVGTHDGSSQKFYKDGSLGSSSTDVFAIDYTKTNNNFAIGANYTGIYDLDGKLDEVRVSNIAHSGEWIEAQYKSMTDDYITFSNPEIASSSSWIAGKYGNALDLNGSSDYILASDSTSLSITGDLSISAWIRPDAIGLEQTVLGKWDETTALLDKSYRLWLDSSNKLNLSVSTDGTTVVTHTGSDTTFAANTWYHIEALYDNAGTMDLYVNGKLDVTQKSSGVPASIDDNISNLYIGGKENTSGTIETLFNGTIDDVRVYNYGRTLKQIYADYNGGFASWLK